MPNQRLTLGVSTLLLVSAVMVAPALLEAQPKPRVAVVSFENRSDFWGTLLGETAADMLVAGLVNSGAFTVIERERIDEILAEQGFQLSGNVNPQHVVEIAKIAGIDYLITGSIGQFSIRNRGLRIGGRGAGYTEAKSDLNVRVFSATTAEIVAASEAEGTKRLVSFSTARGSFSDSSPFDLGVAEEALEPAVEDIVDAILQNRDKLNASATSAADAEPEPPQIVGEGRNGSVYISQGENFHVAVGQRYDVLRLVDEVVIDGVVVDEITEKVGMIEITQVLSQSSVCSVIEGEAILGDRLRPVS